MRTWILTALLAGLSSALAQGQPGPLPDAATCAALIAPQPQSMSPALTAAVRRTVQAYDLEVQRLIRSVVAGSPTPAQAQELTRLGSELTHYLANLLPKSGWPSDPHLRSALWQLLPSPALQWCAGQQALLEATTPTERLQAATLIDQGLMGLGAKQRYGTALQQTGGRLKPLPIEDAEDVDARRNAVGLPPLAEEVVRRQTQLPPRRPPTGLTRPVILNEVCRRFTTAAALNTPLMGGQIDALLEEAARLVEQDQASRLGQPGAKSLAVVDAESTVWLKEVLRQRGWPSTNRSDAELSSNAWLLAQHADARPAVQACILDLIGQQQSTPAEARNSAYLTDRVRLGQGLPQVYGTQVSYDDVQGKATLRPLENPAQVNARRAKIGLEPIEDYLKGFERPRP